MNTDIQQHLKQYREAEQALYDYIDATMRCGTLVRVDYHDRVLHGVSLGPSQGGPDHILVQLERVAIVYAIECVRPITEEEKNNLPKWLRK